MDEDWIRDLYARYGAMVHRRARTLLGDEEAAWDVLQEVFMRAFRNQRAFRHQSSPTTWLYRITTNYCLNLLRDANRHREKLQGLTVTTLHADDPDLRLSLAAVLAHLPVELCEMAVYHYVDRMSQDEIAALFGVARRTVGNRLEEFRSRAQTVLGDSVALLA
jgi:RNA polymerase sigma-70 factor (ECF subfamily)